MTSIGKPLDRVDARAKVTGAADYAADVPVAHVAHAVIVTATAAKGALDALDADAARALPGVIAVITHREAPPLPRAEHVSGKNPGERVLQLLQGDAIHYQDQPIAIVVADTLEQAQHAAARVGARYQGDAHPLVDVTAALPAAYAPKAAGPAGEPDSTRGDVAAALAHAHTTIDARYTTPIENHNPMEPHATTAVWQGDDRLTVYDATQGIFNVRTRLAEIFDLPPDHVRVIDHYVGGGFGCKGTPWSHVALAALAARLVRRPVKLVVTRPQMFSLVGHRPATIQRVVLAATAEGRLTAIRHEVTNETSRIDEFVEPSALQTRHLYACPNVATTHRVVKLDVPTPTFQRAPGEATGTYAIECAMDELAVALAMDPLALRLRNHADRDEQERKPFSSKSLRACYAQAAERFGWARRDPRPRATRDGRWLVGWGMATKTYPARQRPASAIARVRADGTALVQAGTQDLGTGTYTVMTQIAADALGLAPDRVRFELGDTAFPETPVSGGSTTVSSTGSAVQQACAAVRARLAQMTGGDPRESVAALIARARVPEVSAEVHTDEKHDRERFSCHSFGCDFVEVRVDPELGLARVARVVTAIAGGAIINPKTATSQIMGGVIMGIGMALFEKTVRDPRTGRVVTRDLADYHVATAADAPPIDVIFVAEHDPYVNEVGAKGIGEIGITGTAAAVANAIFHATGRRVRDLPITPDRLL